MKFAIVGLGEMGGGLAQQALNKGHTVVGYDRNPARVGPLTEAGLIPSDDLEGLATKLEMPRILFLYLPHGQPLDDAVEALKGILSRGDIVVDGGNSYWEESIRHYQALRSSGIWFLDAGTSGGIEGAHNGASFMVGGNPEAYANVEPLFRDLAVPEGVVYAGPTGSGHFVKLVHSELAFYRYRDPESTAGKAVALLRHMYGGHPLHRKDGGQG